MCELYGSPAAPVNRPCWTFSVLVGGQPRKVRGDTLEELMDKLRVLGGTPRAIAAALDGKEAL